MTKTPAQNTPATIYLKDYARPEFTIEKLDLEFELTAAMTTVKSTMELHKVDATTQHLVLQGEALELISISMNKNILLPEQYRLTATQLTILAVPETFSLEIIVQIKPQENTQLSGLYRSGATFVTQCEAEGFRRITYFLDRPDVLTHYTTKIIADRHQYPHLLSNGNLVAKGELENQRHWVKWEDPFRKPCYLFALVAGQFELLEDYFITQSGRRILLHIYTEKGYLDQCHCAMQAVKKAMTWDEENYGREYDLDIFMIVAISDFNSGAMENKGLNIFNTKYILAKPDTATDEDYIYIQTVVAHEYFHNWTGNRITCRDWFQLSLKEGLTVFRDQSFTADVTDHGVARIYDVNKLRNRQFPEDAGPLAHPVRPDSYIEISNFYTTTIYEKGAEIIRVIQTLLGKVLFRRGMDLYFTRHDGQAVTIEDFVRAMEDASGMNLTQCRLWYEQAGTPLVKVTADYDAATKRYTLTLEQGCLPTPGQPYKKPMHIPVRTALFDHQGQTLLLDTDDGRPGLEKILQLKEITTTVTFKNVPERPIPSLLRHFSAPIKLQFDYSEEELVLLIKHDTDAFNRWEASQIYAQRLLLELIATYQQKRPLQMPEKFTELLRSLLNDKQLNKQLLSALLTLPSEIYLAEHMAVVDVEAIFAAREFVKLNIATALRAEFFATYQENVTTETGIIFTLANVGKRQLKNVALQYLLLLPDPALRKLGHQQFVTSLPLNMTDTMAALRGLSHLAIPERELALEQFYTRWRHEPLIIDKWFAVQAASLLPDTLPQVERLTHHEAFDIKNPNKVYALIGTFGQQNMLRFHAADGAGYHFLGKFILQLDKLNSNVAARMLKPLTEWRRQDSSRAALMCAQLEIMMRTPGISNDIYELVTKSLA